MKQLNCLIRMVVLLMVEINKLLSIQPLLYVLNFFVSFVFVFGLVADEECCTDGHEIDVEIADERNGWWWRRRRRGIGIDAL